MFFSVSFCPPHTHAIQYTLNTPLYYDKSSSKLIIYVQQTNLLYVTTTTVVNDELQIDRPDILHLIYDDHEIQCFIYVKTYTRTHRLNVKNNKKIEIFLEKQKYI